ncbi:hypothetical protein GGF46_003771 [Coemansia sp. RSA 552]|nr:hypothetical protein GGF46_003771 [Coemansia sp. RSA 552]
MRVLRILAGCGVVMGAPVFKEIAHSIGYDAELAANAGTFVSSGVGSVINALGSLDTFKPILYPAIVSALNTLEFFGGLISTLAGWAVKRAVGNAFTGDLLNDTPYIGELIRNADAMMAPEYKDMVSSLDRLLPPQTTGAYS